MLLECLLSFKTAFSVQAYRKKKHGIERNGISKDYVIQNDYRALLDIQTKYLRQHAVLLNQGFIVRVHVYVVYDILTIRLIFFN